MRLLAAVCCLAAVSADPIVKTRLGTITGLAFDFSSHRGDIFFGIPYAKPPVGDLRFELPVPFGEFGNLTADQTQAWCVGRVITGLSSEDCLYLNVFRPEGIQPEDRKPVFVFFQGGHGEANRQIIPLPLSYLGDVITVLVNHRYGLLGFANFKDLAPGNVGFFDQRLALEWVKDNIDAFGGNPDEITIGGLGLGSASVHAHIVTPLNRGKRLFNAAYMDAGFLGPGLNEETEESFLRLQKIALKVNCPTQNRIMVRCLKNLDIFHLVRSQTMFNVSEKLPVFHPTIDGVFIPKHVDEMDVNDFANVKLMVGVSQDDGSAFVNGEKPFLNITDTEEECLEYCAKMGKLFSSRANFSDPSIRQKIITTYYNRYPTQFDRVSHFITDSSFLCPAKHFVGRYARHNQNVYMFHFERHIWMPKFEAMGSYHGCPSLSFLGTPLAVPFPDLREKRFLEDAVKVFSQFTRTNHALEFRGVKWPDFAEAGKVLRIGETPIVADSLPNQRICEEIFS